MSSKEFLSTSFSKNIAALKYSIISCYSRSPGEVIKPGDESECTGMLRYQNKENGGETMTFDNIIRLTLMKGVPQFLFTLKREGVTKLFERFRCESPYFLDKC